MRFLLVTRYFGGEQTPTGRMARDVGAQLKAMGHEVGVFASDGTYAATAEVNPDATHGLEVRRVPEWGKTRLVSWGGFWFQTMFHIPCGRWDRCILLSDPPFLPVAAWLTRLFRGRQRRLYWWTMDLYPEALVAAGLVRDGEWRCYVLRWLNELGLTALDGVVALGPRQLQRLTTYRRWNQAADFAIVVPPWDLRPLRRVPAEANGVARRLSGPGIKIALYAGNLGEGHLCSEFVAGARHFLQRGRNDWRFIFAVRGSGRARLLAQAAEMSNVRVMDYLPEHETAELLWAATVHLISMKPGWEGVIVPSKLYGALQTSAPALFVGPTDADTATELTRLGRGATLPPGACGEAVATTLDELAHSNRCREPQLDDTGPRQIAEFVAR